MKIILAFDSFKGSMTADEAVAAARAGVLAVLPEAEAVCLPLADGGEGTTDALARYVDVQRVSCPVHDPLMRPMEASYVISSDKQTAIMEMAAAAGLTLLSEPERNPMRTTTFGVGEMLNDAIDRGCIYIIIGIGGSATCDGGMGMLAAMGVQFFDKAGNLLQPIGRNLENISTIDWSGLRDTKGVRIDVVCDVDNPLYGAEGAACVFAPQKGANATEVEQLDRGLRQLAALCPTIPDDTKALTPMHPGCGAAGGLGFALQLLGGHLRRGTDVVLDTAGIDSQLTDADLVITGEGKIDRQTLNGKLPYGVLQRAKSHGIPTIAIAGCVEDADSLMAAGFTKVVASSPSNLPLNIAMRTDVAQANLAAATRQAIKDLFADKTLA